MKDLNALTVEDFEACVGSTFALAIDDQNQIELELIQAKNAGHFDPEFDSRQAFSVLFRGPKEPSLQQRMYQLGNAALGDLQLFLVPVGPDKTGSRYEAIFG